MTAGSHDRIHFLAITAVMQKHESGRMGQRWTEAKR